MSQRILLELKNLVLFISEVDYTIDTNVKLDSDVRLMIKNPDNEKNTVCYYIKYSNNFKIDKSFKVDGADAVLWMLPQRMKNEIKKTYKLYSAKENEQILLRRRLKI